MISESNQHFDELIAGLKKEDQYQELEVSTVVQSGHPTVALLSKARELKADLIIMGTKGATGKRSAVFGGVATSVIRKSEIPVLAVPPGASTEDLKHIIFATDYHEGDLQALKQTTSFAKLFNASIEIIHVAEEQNLLTEIKFRGFRDLAAEQTDYENMTFELKYESDFFPAMADYFVDNLHSLLVMVRHKKAFWENLVERDHSREMVFYSRVPILVLIGT